MIRFFLPLVILSLILVIFFVSAANCWLQTIYGWVITLLCNCSFPLDISISLYAKGRSSQPEGYSARGGECAPGAGGSSVYLRFALGVAILWSNRIILKPFLPPRTYTNAFQCPRADTYSLFSYVHVRVRVCMNRDPFLSTSFSFISRVSLCFPLLWSLRNGFVGKRKLKK